MNTQIIPVPSYEGMLVLTGKDNEPFVAMKPVVENMGLAWQVQQRKISEKFKSTVTLMVTTGADGKNYEMTCLPLRKLAAWLYSININKVAPELRGKITRYQNECDDVLWNYWTQEKPTLWGSDCFVPGRGAQENSGNSMTARQIGIIACVCTTSGN